MSGNKRRDNKQAGQFASRIVGEGDEAPDQLMANPMNWRTHPKAQQDALEGVLNEVGWVQRIIVNRRTGHVVDGHARVELALRRNEQSVPVLYVDLSEDEEKLVLAALDPIGALAGRDDAKLAELLTEVETADAGLQALLDELAEGLSVELSDAEKSAASDMYSQKIEPPTYTPKGEKPPISDLFDREKADMLARRIEDAKGIPEDVKAFLRVAALRHIVFDYRNIAEYYCHASPEVQDLMEQSALVIIDFKKAIEGGYIELSKKLSEIYAATADEDEDEDADS